MFARLGERNGGFVGSNAVAGFGAETLALVMYTPLDVAKQRLQVSPVGTTVGSMARALLRERGVAGLWSGYMAGLAVWGPYSAIYFGVYEAVKQAVRGRKNDGTNYKKTRRVGENGHGNKSSGGVVFSPIEFVAGLTGGAAGAVATQPLDCVKTRMQVGAQEVSAVLGQGDHRRRVVPAGWGLVRTFRMIVTEEGAAVLWRGAAARALHLAPGAGITISLFEAMYRVLEPINLGMDDVT